MLIFKQRAAASLPAGFAIDLLVINEHLTRSEGQHDK